MSLPLLLFLAPSAAAVRSVGRWRRGRDERLSMTRRPSPVPGMERIDLILDAPSAAELDARRRLTHALAAVAELAAAPGDTYVTAYRPPDSVETSIAVVGRRVQQLGQRIWLLLGRSQLVSRTIVWVSLPPGGTMAQVDPLAWDPDAAGEPDRLLRYLEPRWAVAACVARDGVAVRYRVVLDVPAEHVAGSAALMERLRHAGSRAEAPREGG